MHQKKKKGEKGAGGLRERGGKTNIVRRGQKGKNYRRGNKGKTQGKWRGELQGRIMDSRLRGPKTQPKRGGGRKSQASLRIDAWSTREGEGRGLKKGGEKNIHREVKGGEKDTSGVQHKGHLFCKRTERVTGSANPSH